MARAKTMLSIPMVRVVFPSVSKVVSREPFELYRATAKLSLLAPSSENPAATILPSGWIPIESISPSFDPIAVVTIPAVPKVVSREPFELYRISAKSSCEFHC